MREVESEYIREEILMAFDVSCVFDRRDEAYYDFKPAIDSKEQLREIVQQAAADADNSAAIISQLERWWDKYKVSLHELDAEVAKAESVMKGYLKELGV